MVKLRYMICTAVQVKEHLHEQDVDLYKLTNLRKQYLARCKATCTTSCIDEQDVKKWPSGGWKHAILSIYRNRILALNQIGHGHPSGLWNKFEDGRISIQDI